MFRALKTRQLITQKILDWRKIQILAIFMPAELISLLVVEFLKKNYSQRNLASLKKSLTCLLKLFQIKAPHLNLHVILNKNQKFQTKIKYSNNSKFNSDNSRSSKRSRDFWSRRKKRKRSN
jgi:hypothetical protein